MYVETYKINFRFIGGVITTCSNGNVSLRRNEIEIVVILLRNANKKKL